MNELRKKTTDKNLSKRIKNLVRRWQDVVNKAGIDLNQPFKKAVGTINGKHTSSTPSPSLSISQLNGKLKNGGVANSLTTTNSPVAFSSFSSSPAFSDPSRSRQSTPIHTPLPLNGRSVKTISPIVNNSHNKSAFMPVPVCPSAKNKLSVINGHSNKIPTNPPTNISTCDNKKVSSQLAGKKRKTEVDPSDSKNDVVNKKLKLSSSNSNLNGSLNNHIANKLEVEKSLNESNNQLKNNKVYNNEDIKSSKKMHANGFVNGTSFEEKLFSCNSTGNLKCKISRSKLVQTPPIPSSSNKLKSTLTPPFPFVSKVKSTTTPPISMLRSRTPIPSSISSKTSKTPPIQSFSNKLKFSNTPPIPSRLPPSQKPLKKSATASSALHNNFKPVLKNSKVETTAQILQKLHSCSNLPLSQALKSISNNRIKREHSEDEEVSVLPSTMKPRGGKKKSQLVPPQSNPQEVARAKNERMQIFLHSTSSIIPKNNSSSNLESYKTCKEESKSKMYNNNVKSKDKSHSINTDTQNNSMEPGEVKEVDVRKLDPASVEYRTALLKNPWAFLPPLADLKRGDEGDGKEGSEAGDLEERLNKLSLHKWSGVNGVKDPNGEWRDWTSSFSVKVNNDYCHVLPYVCL